MVDFIYMGFLKLQGAEARFTKRKILLAHSGTRTHDLSARLRRADIGTRTHDLSARLRRADILSTC